jgi:thymidylate synthase
MNNLDLQYQNLLRDIIDHGTKKTDRTGTGTISLFGKQIRHNMSEGFPLLTTKKMAWKSVVTELLWFLKGDTNIKFLLDHNCNIWTGDAYKRYKKYAGSLEEPDMNVHVEDISESKIRIMTESEFIDSIKNWEELYIEIKKIALARKSNYIRFVSTIDSTKKLQFLEELKTKPSLSKPKPVKQKPIKEKPLTMNDLLKANKKFQALSKQTETKNEDFVDDFEGWGKRRRRKKIMLRF